MTRYPTKVSELPTAPFFAVLEPKSTFVPGNERSRINPGHGYGDHTDESWSLIVFASEEEWRADVERRATNPHGYSYKAVKIFPANVTVSTNVSIV